MNYSRKSFIKVLGVGASVLAAGHSPLLAAENKKSINPGNKFKLGLASYSLRKFNLDEALAMSGRLNLKYLALKSMHMPLDSSNEQIISIRKKIDEAGQVLYGAGVIYMKSESEVDNAFRYAQAAGLDVIIGVPNHNLLELVNKKVKQTNIKVAIHNHGPNDKLYPTPVSIFEKIDSLDSRIGLCLDIGHVARLGLNPVDSIKKYAGRIHDVHFKDVDKAAPEGKSIEIGRGVINIHEVLKAVRKINYSGVLALEFEKDGENPLPGIAESVGFVRGVINMM